MWRTAAGAKRTLTVLLRARDRNSPVSLGGHGGHKERKPDGTYVVQVRIQNVSANDEVIGGGDHLWLAGASGEVPSGDPRNPADGRHYRGGAMNLKPCGWVTVAYTFDRLPSAPRDLYFQPSYGRRAKWDVSGDFTSSRRKGSQRQRLAPNPNPARRPRLPQSRRPR
jgi:hypothetical protein